MSETTGERLLRRTCYLFIFIFLFLLQRFHLQALRHLYVLACEPRLFVTRDVDTKDICYTPIQVTLKVSKMISGALFCPKASNSALEFKTPSRFFSFCEWSVPFRLCPLSSEINFNNFFIINAFHLQETDDYPETDVKMLSPCFIPESKFVKKVSC